MRDRKILMTLVLWVLLSFCLLAENRESETFTVTAVGEAAGTGLAAKEKSRENALRSAVEKGFGVYIDSATLTENAVLVHDDIVAKTRGYVNHYDILEQKEQGGIFTTKIKAEVSMEKIWESESLNLLLKRMGAPRFTIAAAEYHNGKPVLQGFALQKITEILVSRGFHLVHTPRTGNPGTGLVKNALDDEHLAASIGKKAGAEIIVLIHSSGTFQSDEESYGTSFKLFDGHCQVKAVQVDTQKIVASTVKTRKSGSLKNAIMAAASDNAGEIVKQLFSAWSAYLNMGRNVEMIITGISVSDLIGIVEEMQSVEGVSSVVQRDFAGGRARLEIKSKHKTIYLAESIKNLPGFKLEISSFSADKIVVRRKN